jgi:hypothetical protein
MEPSTPEITTTFINIETQEESINVAQEATIPMEINSVITTEPQDAPQPVIESTNAQEEPVQPGFANVVTFESLYVGSQKLNMDWGVFHTFLEEITHYPTLETKEKKVEFGIGCKQTEYHIAQWKNITKSHTKYIQEELEEFDKILLHLFTLISTVGIKDTTGSSIGHDEEATSFFVFESMVDLCRKRKIKEIPPEFSLLSSFIAVEGDVLDPIRAKHRVHFMSEMRLFLMNMMDRIQTIIFNAPTSEFKAIVYKVVDRKELNVSSDILSLPMHTSNHFCLHTPFISCSYNPERHVSTLEDSTDFKYDIFAIELNKGARFLCMDDNLSAEAGRCEVLLPFGSCIRLKSANAVKVGYNAKTCKKNFTRTEKGFFDIETEILDKTIVESRQRYFSASVLSNKFASYKAKPSCSTPLMNVLNKSELNTILEDLDWSAKDVKASSKREDVIKSILDQMDDVQEGAVCKPSLLIRYGLMKTTLFIVDDIDIGVKDLKESPVAASDKLDSLLFFYLYNFQELLPNLSGSSVPDDVDTDDEEGEQANDIAPQVVETVYTCSCCDGSCGKNKPDDGKREQEDTIQDDSAKRQKL